MVGTSPVFDIGTPIDSTGSLKGCIFMTESYRTLVGSILDEVSFSLRPFLAATLKGRINSGDWTELLELKDQMDGREVRRVDEKDLVAQIRILTTRLPQVGYLVELDRRQTRYLGEIRDYRNDWAHGASFAIDDVRRLGDTTTRLLTGFGLEDGSAKIHELLNRPAADSADAVTPDAAEHQSEGPAAPEAAKADGAQISLTVQHQPQVNFALVNWITMSATGNGSAQGIDLIDSVMIRNDGSRTGTATFTTQLFGAQGPLSDPAEQVLELSAGENHLNDTGLVPDPARFFDVEVPEAGRLEFTLSQGGETLARHVTQISIQPPQSWSLSKERSGLHSELLAAWVQPQDPALAPVIERAQEILKDQTGSSALNAHQQDSERNGHIVNSIFQALQDQKIRYSNPPASWFQSQTIRSPQTVLRDRIGTCLDTSVLLASLLEQVGMFPQICLVKGHAFVTVSAERGGIGQSQDDATLVGQWIDAGRLKILESTAVTDEKRASLEVASLATRSTYFGAPSQAEAFDYLTDIASARASGIYPLPVRRTSPAGDTQVIAYQPPERRDVGALWRDAKSESDASVVQSDGRVLPGRVVQWKNQLLDLSLRNRLLNFNSERVRLPLAVPSGSVDLFEDLLNDGKALDLLPSDAISPTDLNLYGSGMGLPEPRRDELMLEKSRVYVKDDSAQYTKRLRKLAADTKTELQQSGTNNLYISLGTLVWTAKDSKGGKTLRSPLILIPVELKSTGKNSTYRLTMDASGESTPNYCLLERLWQDHQLKLPGLENLVADRFGMDVSKAFDSITSSLLEHQLDFYVEKSVDLATLQFAKFRLWKDLDENWEKFAKNPLVDHLIHHPTEVFEDSAATDAAEEPIELDDLVAKLPVPADGTQLDSVAMSKQGRSFVIEGPPGTGKSQTITNLLAAAMADGKKVLFVAEKSAALDVVSSRLNAVGLGPFTLDLHDKNSSAVSVRRQIQQSLDHQIRGDEQGHRLVHQDLHSLQRKLNRYARQLHEDNPVGYSVYSARSLELALDDDIPVLPMPTEFAATRTEEDVESIRYALQDVPELAELVDRVRHHPWGFANGCPAEDLTTVLAASEAYSAARHDLLSGEHATSAQLVLDVDPDPTFLQGLCELIDTSRPLQDLEAALSPGWSPQIEDVLNRSDALRSSESVFETFFNLESRDDDFPALIQQAEEAAASGFLGIGRKKKLLHVADSVTGGWLGDDEAVVQLPGLLRSAAESAAEARQIETTAAAIAGVSLGEDWSAFDADASTLLRDKASRLHDHAVQWNGLRSGHSAEVRQVIDRAAAGELNSLMPVLSVYGDALARLKSAVRAPEDAWAEWQAGLPLSRRWVETDVQRASGYSATDQLSSWLRFVRSLDVLREHGLDDARLQLLTGEADAERAVQSFEKGLAHTALGERLTATGLQRFPAKAHERDIQQFDAKSADIRRHIEWKIPDGLLKRRARYEQSDVAGMGRLRREINKKNGGLSVRQLMEHHGHRVQSLMPCILVSPDSVARFFPPHTDMFDLVVFDEASQVRVADAVGAMGRGNAVIVVGDSKQMPPTTFGASTWNEVGDTDELVADGEFEVVTDEESILSECVQARVPRKWLSWHYRSKDESLIAFSNQMYYERKLASFPASRFVASGPGEGGFGVSWIKVDGHFIRSKDEGSKLLRTNPKEATAIVDEIRRRFHAGNGEVSLGVVTFNKQQKDLIEDLIRQDDDERMAQSLDGENEGLFVKNLENVQGDERDVILFSTGFSANDKGQLPLNFGPINNSGGERRLNVAVTRARRQVVVFSSFEPEELRSENTSSLGIKHLRAYLDMAKYGPGTLPAADRTLDRVDRHRDQIAEVFRQAGLAVATDVGLSDFKIDLSLADPDRPDEPLVAVLLDGEEWSQRLTVGDRDGLPGQILKKNLEWPEVVRIWLPEWLQASSEVKDRVLFSYRSALRRREEDRVAQQRRPLQPASVAESPVEQVVTVNARGLGNSPEASLQYAAPVAVQDVESKPSLDHSPDSAFVDTETPSQFPDPRSAPDDEPSTSAGQVRAQSPDTSDADLPRESVDFDATTFRPQPVKEAVITVGGTVEDLDRLDDPDVQSLIKDKIAAVVRDESPIHEDRLSKVVNHSFGLKRASASRSQAVKNLIDTDVFVIDEDAFVWPRTVNRDTWFEHRTFGSDHVGVSDASPLEVANALMLIVMRTGPRDKEDLFERSKARLGYGRLGNKVVDLLERAVEVGISTGRLRRNEDGTITTDLDL
ncbi:DUF4011 domain-containing protein [Citricoccus nitrophenolicus]